MPDRFPGALGAGWRTIRDGYDDMLWCPTCQQEQSWRIEQAFDAVSLAPAWQYGDRCYWCGAERPEPSASHRPSLVQNSIQQGERIHEAIEDALDAERGVSIEGLCRAATLTFGQLERLRLAEEYANALLQVRRYLQTDPAGAAFWTHQAASLGNALLRDVPAAPPVTTRRQTR